MGTRALVPLSPVLLRMSALRCSHSSYFGNGCGLAALRLSSASGDWARPSACRLSHTVLDIRDGVGTMTERPTLARSAVRPNPLHVNQIHFGIVSQVELAVLLNLIVFDISPLAPHRIFLRILAMLQPQRLSRTVLEDIFSWDGKMHPNRARTHIPLHLCSTSTVTWLTWRLLPVILSAPEPRSPTQYITTPLCLPFFFRLHPHIYPTQTTLT
ncbi:hypothetical protein C8F04DRAFT_94151 [Mycena alexandri]|uniref:Uncharacterized protein n=1 Tax=Mycena alexandri TaxID=1745969 RepID=A0AAD6SFU8_9AGAR|nr:hypothetical protein C8F04DRAFT_94151 [Mycena alexandri]